MIRYFSAIFLTLSINAIEELCKDLKPAESLAVKSTARGETTILARLLKSVGPNSRTPNDLTLLHVAVHFNQPEAARLLLEQEGIRIEAKSGEYFDATPLQLAASLGRREIVEILVANRASLTSTNNNGQTANQLAIEALNGQCENDPTASQNPDDYLAIIQLTQGAIN